MGSVHVDIADAVTLVISGGSYSQEFNVSRKHAHQIDRVNHQLECYVVPKSEAISVYARNMIRREVGIDVAIIGPASDESTREGLSDLVEEVSASLRGIQMASADWIGETREPIYNIENISGLDQFTAVLTESYVIIETY